MSHKLFWTLLVVLMLATSLAGCAPAAATPALALPTATFTAEPLATDTLPPPTATVTSTPEPPTSTAVPTATPTLAPTATATAEPTATFTPTVTRQPGASIPGAYGAKTGVVIYMIAQNTGGPLCGDTAVKVPVAVPRTKNTAADIEAALDMLFSLKSKYYGNLYNPVSYSTLRVQEVDLDEVSGGLTVWFSGKYRPSGDDCDNIRVKAQIWNTAKQFGVSGTAFYINGPHPFGDFLSNDK